MTVVSFDGLTKAFIPADNILENNKGKMDGVVLIGYNEEGDFVFGSSWAELDRVLLLLKLAECHVMEWVREDE